MFTAIYPRVSTKHQANDGTSLDGQIEMCRNKAKELGIPESEIKIYREEGFTGEDIDRPKMNELREDVKNGLINRVIIVHPDRLSRELVDKLIVCGEFEKHDVELVFVDVEYKNTPEGSLFFNISSSIAEYELSLIKKRTSRGVMRSVKEKQNVMPMRYKPFGYDYIDKKLVVNSDESPFVEMIYKWYAYEGLTMRQIGEKLYELGVKPKSKQSKNWSASSIANILTNEVYIGKYYYNRRRTQKIKGQKTAKGNPKREYEYRDKEDWILVEVPRIISDSLFNLAQEKRKKNGEHSGNLKHQYLLRGKLKCGHCGLKYSAFSTSTKQTNKNGETKSWTFKRYRCGGTILRTYGDNIKKCDVPLIKAEDFDESIWNRYIMKIISHPNPMDLFINSESEGDDLEVKLQYFTKQLDEKEKERERVKTMFKLGVSTEEEMLKDFEEINATTEKLKFAIDDIKDVIAAKNNSNEKQKQLEEIISRIKVMIENNEGINFELKSKIVDILIDEIVISYEDDDKTQLVVNVHRAINGDLLSELGTQHQGIKDTNHRVNMTGEIGIAVDRKVGKKTRYGIIKHNVKLY